MKIVIVNTQAAPDFGTRLAELKEKEIPKTLYTISLPFFKDNINGKEHTFYINKTITKNESELLIYQANILVIPFNNDNEEEIKNWKESIEDSKNTYCLFVRVNQNQELDNVFNVNFDNELGDLINKINQVELLSECAHTSSFTRLTNRLDNLFTKRANKDDKKPHGKNTQGY